MEYSYIVLGSSSDLYKFSYSDFKQVDNAYYLPGMESNLNEIEKLLFRMHTWRKLNNIINIPLKKAWNYFLLGLLPVREENKTCFIFLSNWVEYEDEIHIMEYLRRKYKGCKLVWFLQDIIEIRTMIDGRPFPMDELKEKFDLVISFDQNDCKKYNLIYHHLVFSSYQGDLVEMPESDVYFVGKAKNRLSEIIKVYKILREHGLKCDFHISGVPVQNQIYGDEIDYDPHITYNDNLQHILHTKCLLEVMQQGGAGFTQRGCEAVCLDKKLLTNNSEIKEAPFYMPEYISQFINADNIDSEFLNNIKNDTTVDYNYKREFSPVKFIQFVEDLLS